MLITSDESNRSEAQKQQRFSQHLFLLLHFQNHSFRGAERSAFFFPAGFLYN